MLIPVLLAGGVGSRLWPASRALLPKQFIRFPGHDSTLFQNTVARTAGMEELGEYLVVCSHEHRFLVAEQLRQLQLESDPQLSSSNKGEKFDCSILLEPVGRNTAPAVALAALKAQQDSPDPILLILPADHIIQDKPAFQAGVRQGLQFARQGKLVTFGIVPGSPETGFGYIEKGESLAANVHVVTRFVEKPDQQSAKLYLATGNYLWNSGMFMFSATQYLRELKRYAPDIFASCHDAYAALESASDFQLIPEQEFGRCRAESIDYALMEKTDNAVVIPMDVGWSDLGAWNALWEIENKDADGNVVSGDVLMEGVRNSYIQSQSRLVAAVGLMNTVIVETADAVLVANRDHVQAVKSIVNQLQSQDRSESRSHTLVNRPWGSYESLAVSPGYQVKHIIVNPGAALSLQLHNRRAEHWTVIKGKGLVTCDEREFSLQANESTFIPLGSKHRLSNPGTEPVELIEVQLGDYLGEDDIVRFEDRYGRVSS